MNSQHNPASNTRSLVFQRRNIRWLHWGRTGVLLLVLATLVPAHYMARTIIPTDLISTLALLTAALLVVMVLLGSAKDTLKEMEFTQGPIEECEIVSFRSRGLLFNSGETMEIIIRLPGVPTNTTLSAVNVPYIHAKCLRPGETLAIQVSVASAIRADWIATENTQAKQRSLKL